MKFAKRLQEELEQSWDGQYLDYKLLKKVMKQGETQVEGGPRQVLQSFCNALDTELHKVHIYMRHQQEELQDELPLMLPVPEDPLVARPRGRSRGSLSDRINTDNCGLVVRKIESFRHYSDLNIEAMRKIIKKFDKRFHCRFQEVIGLPSTAGQLVTAQDISLRLLQPAQECLKQIRYLSAKAFVLERPERPLLRLRQFTFWVRELQSGVQLLGLHISGSGEELSNCVKNTFIEIRDFPESPLRRTRAHSWCGTRVQVVVPLEDGGLGDDEDEVRSVSHLSSPGSFESGQLSGSGLSGSNSESSSRPGKAERLSPGSQAGSTKPPASSSHQPEGKKPRGSSQRWWTELSDTCAISGFPIAYLPYPPFKLQTGQGRTTKFVDGQYLLLHILSTLNFEVLGRTLTKPEIEAVDQHVKKCKLSPMRLSHTLELLCQAGRDAPAAKKELSELRQRASKKLGALKHIQRVRWQRGDCAGAPATPGRVEPAQVTQAKGKGRHGKASKPRTSAA